MRFSTTVAAAAVAGGALAKDINVSVGKSGLKFEPAEITAAEGDNIYFKFWPKNHSVAQAAFAKPCEPLEGGLWSGFVPTTDTAKAAELTYMFTVTNASAPIWFYCTQGQHCQNGMVGVINPPYNNNNRTLQAFTEAAAQARQNVSPTSTAGEGGMLMNGTDHSTTPTSSGSATSGSPTGAASSLQVNSLAFSGVFGMLAYLVL
ncbi:uncharacterized protein EI97DRAFT_374424 [Westerdykella ornata]|uniref:Cupredoxin n=1 Tax=Westerdykella ornata TaxID=318751 RepID=A0A6A6JN74_WESOR|nr:uncharacterized protein EI97DRAFT_374424 [Westerdykella ornata]KAF2277952.1 hypothetical protein EI97DRAFT_374424 [Westerdykella ornata]